jgi:uncharacterized protein YraI
MKKLTNVLAAIVLATSSGMAWAETSCTVTDPTGTPLNVRSRPNGQIVGALHNQTRVFISGLVADARGRRWAKIVPLDEGKAGWVFREYVACEMPDGAARATRSRPGP